MSWIIFLFLRYLPQYKPGFRESKLHSSLKKAFPRPMHSSLQPYLANRFPTSRPTKLPTCCRIRSRSKEGPRPYPILPIYKRLPVNRPTTAAMFIRDITISVHADPKWAIQNILTQRRTCPRFGSLVDSQYKCEVHPYHFKRLKYLPVKLNYTELLQADEVRYFI